MSNIFTESALTIFDVLKNITNDDGTVVKEAQYVAKTDDGWGTVSEDVTDVEIVFDSFSQEDLQVLTFSKLVQHTDIKGMVPGEFLEVEPSVDHVIRVGSKEYAIVAFDTDPAGALFIILLRGTN